MRFTRSLVLGIALIVAGALLLGYDHFSYTTKETVARVGPITAQAERTKTVRFPPVLGWVLVGAGVLVVVVGASRKGP